MQTVLSLYIYCPKSDFEARGGCKQMNTNVMQQFSRKSRRATLAMATRAAATPNEPKRINHPTSAT